MANFEGDVTIAPADGSEPAIDLVLEIDNYALPGWTAFLPPYLYPPPPPLRSRFIAT